MFARVLVAVDSRSGRRDALVLGAQLADANAAIVVADLLPTSRTPLAGGLAAAARRRESLRDAGEEVYATLGPDPRVHYLPVSGLALADALVAIAHGERSAVIVVAQSAVGPDGEVARLVARAPCPVAVAPFGHRFARSFAPRRVGVAAGDPRAHELLVAASRIVPAGACVLVDRGADADLLIVGDVGAEQLHEAACPALVIGEQAAAPLFATPSRR